MYMFRIFYQFWKRYLNVFSFIWNFPIISFYLHISISVFRSISPFLLIKRLFPSFSSVYMSISEISDPFIFATWWCNFWYFILSIYWNKKFEILCCKYTGIEKLEFVANVQFFVYLYSLVCFCICLYSYKSFA